MKNSGKINNSNTSKVLKVLEQNISAFPTIIAIVISMSLGCFIRVTNSNWDQRSIKYIGFPGELFLRVLNSLIIPLIVTSLVFALANSDTKTSAKILTRICIYYFTTTLFAVILGIVVVSGELQLSF